MSRETSVVCYLDAVQTAEDGSGVEELAIKWFVWLESHLRQLVVVVVAVVVVLTVRVVITVVVVLVAAVVVGGSGW